MLPSISSFDLKSSFFFLFLLLQKVCINILISFVVLKVICIVGNGHIYVNNGEEMTAKYMYSICNVATLYVEVSEVSFKYRGHIGSGHRFDNASDSTLQCIV